MRCLYGTGGASVALTTYDPLVEQNRCQVGPTILFECPAQIPRSSLRSFSRLSSEHRKESPPSCFDFSRILLLDEQEFRLRIDESLDQPRTSQTVNLDIFPRNLFHIHLTVAKNM